MRADVPGKEEDYWESAAESYDEKAARHWAAEDRLRDLMASLAVPCATVVDIGAGTGYWSLFFARTAVAVTAIDSSPAMLRVMRHKVAASGLANIEMIEGVWPDVEIGSRDLCFCAHASYGARDLGAFIEKMDDTASIVCALLVREPRLPAVREEIEKLGIVPELVMGDDTDGERRSGLLHWRSRGRRTGE